MKKYVKPELFYEHYELSKHIANCDWEMTLGQVSSCSAVLENGGGIGHLFATGNSACDYIPHTNPDGSANSNGNFLDYCYTNGTGGIVVFIS